MNTLKLFRATACAFLVAGMVGSSTHSTPAAAEQKGKPSKGPSIGADFLARRVDRCAVRTPSTEQQTVIERAANAGRDPGGVVNIPVYWHIITTKKGDGNVSHLVPAQMEVLNAAYSGSRFRFRTPGRSGGGQQRVVLRCD